MWYDCETCVRGCQSQQAINQHMTATGHWRKRYECQTCDNQYFDEDDCDRHMSDMGHWAATYDCEACNLKFQTFQGARSHMDSCNHWRLNWCGGCQRGFQNANNLQQHLRGSAHRGGSILCPFCKKPHTTASGIAHHLETNSCPNAKGLNRETIYRIINERDTSGVITNKLLTWDNGSNADYTASDRAWNGRNFECYICHRGYGSLKALNQHLASPAHKQKVYHCFGGGCGRQFTALAALFGHLESESCGATRFENVQRGASQVLMGRGMIAF